MILVIYEFRLSLTVLDVLKHVQNNSSVLRSERQAIEKVILILKEDDRKDWKQALASVDANYEDLPLEFVALPEKAKDPFKDMVKVLLEQFNMKLGGYLTECKQRRLGNQWRRLSVLFLTVYDAQEPHRNKREGFCFFSKLIP